MGEQLKVTTLMQRVTAGQGARSAKREDAAAQHGISVQKLEPLRANRRVIGVAKREAKNLKDPKGKNQRFIQGHERNNGGSH